MTGTVHRHPPALCHPKVGSSEHGEATWFGRAPASAGRASWSTSSTRALLTQARKTRPSASQPDDRAAAVEYRGEPGSGRARATRNRRLAGFIPAMVPAVGESVQPCTGAPLHVGRRATGGRTSRAPRQGPREPRPVYVRAMERFGVGPGSRRRREVPSARRTDPQNAKQSHPRPKKSASRPRDVPADAPIRWKTCAHP